MNKDFLDKVIENSKYSVQTTEELKKCIPQVVDALSIIKQDSNKFQPNRNEVFFLGDIHGNLPGAVKAISHMGFIDKSGNWQSNDNILIQTGDVIDRGPYSLATLLYFKALKEQISEFKQSGLMSVGDFKLLIGNHEQYIARYNDSCSSDKPAYSREASSAIVELIQTETLKGNYDIMFADNKKNLLATHGEFSKQLLLKIVSDYIFTNDTLDKKIFSAGKISKNDIYKMLEDNNITKEDIANRLNSLLHKEGINGAKIFDLYQSVEYSGPKGIEDRENISKSEFKEGLSKGCKQIAKGTGLGWRKAKAIKAVIGLINDLNIHSITSEKNPNTPVTITAHTVMYDTYKKSGTKSQSLENYFAPGKITNIHSTIYIDTNISENKIAYLRIDNQNNVLAYESPDKGETFTSRSLGNSSPVFKHEQAYKKDVPTKSMIEL
jgi:hypothetical protein